MATLFTWLSGVLSASPLPALGGSFAWGILSVLLSPCHLAGIPLIIGYINDQRRMSTHTAFLLALSFSAGILVTIALVGLATGLAGRMLGDTGPAGTYFVAALFLLVGLHFLGIVPLPFSGTAARPAFAKKGFWGAFILGLLFGIALGPCTFAFMAPVLGAAFAAAHTRLFFAVSLVTAYALGHCAVIVAAGTSTEAVQAYLDWNENSRGTLIVKRICGVIIMAGGAYLLYGIRK